jgi:hypothetical protein
VVVQTLEVDPSTSDFSGPNHLDIAVSKTSDPTVSYTIYRLPVQDDGTDGTPDHGCVGGPCFGAHPRIGADASGFYITTNEFALFGPDFHGAQVYAFSKSALAAGAAPVAATQFDTAGTVNGGPGFTVWPAQSPGTGSYNHAAGRTENFLSSDAALSASNSSTNLIVWSLASTQSLNTASPALSLTHKVLTVNKYAVPPPSDQKTGPTPFATSQGAPESKLDSNDSRMQQVTYANGKLWGALDTALTINGADRAGIAWYIVNPNAGSLVKQGFLRLANNNLTYPAIGVTPSGRGAMAFHRGRRRLLPQRRLRGHQRAGRDGRRPCRCGRCCACRRLHGCYRRRSRAVGRLRRRGGRRQLGLDRDRVHPRHPAHRARELGNADQQGDAVTASFGS